MSCRPTGTRASVTVIVTVAVVAAVVVAAGVWVLAAPAAPTGDPIGAEASEAYAAVDGVEATETTVVERGGETSRTVAEVALRPGTDVRRATVVSGDRTHDVTVSNGSALWLYDSDAGAATRVPLSGTSTAATDGTPGDRIERLFAALNVTRPSGSAETTSSAVPALPVVPQAGTAADAPAATGDSPLALRFDGTESVDGREAYVLRVEPDDDADGAYSQTLWVDAETFFPLQRQTEWTDDGTPVTVTTTYTNVTFDPGLDEETFAFDPPADATVETVETPDTTAYGSVHALRDATDAPVPDPELPASFRLEYATETSGQVNGAGVRYANDTALVTAATYDRTIPVDGDRTVTVDGHEATVDVGPTTSVSWNCGEYRYTVRGQGVSTSFLVEVARSTGCE